MHPSTLLLKQQQEAAVCVCAYRYYARVEADWAKCTHQVQ